MIVDVDRVFHVILLLVAVLLTPHRIPAAVDNLLGHQTKSKKEKRHILLCAAANWIFVISVTTISSIGNDDNYL